MRLEIGGVCVFVVCFGVVLVSFLNFCQGFLTKMDSLSKLHLLGKSNNTSSTEGTADDFEETSELSAANWAKTNIVEQHSPPKQQPDDVDTSELSVAPNWAPTKRVADHNSESSEEGVEDSPYIPRPPPAVDPPSVAFDDVVNEEDEISMSEMSEMMIRVNTATDLAAENPFAFFSPPRDVDSRSQAPLQEQQPRQPEHQPSQPSPAKESPSRKTREDFAKDSPSKKYVPSASLRVQHNDAWLRQFILPLPHDEVKRDFFFFVLFLKGKCHSKSLSSWRLLERQAEI